MTTHLVRHGTGKPREDGDKRVERAGVLRRRVEDIHELGVHGGGVHVDVLQRGGDVVL